MCSKKMQEDILNLMKEPVSRPTDILKRQVSKRCQALASFMESLMDEVTQPDLKLDLPQESELTASERDSVMLGEISPHHDYYDSKSSSETPPSYTQLNYNDNLLRFFNSRPKTLDAFEDGNKLEGSGSDLSPNQRFEGSGDSRSAENCSSGSNHLIGSVSTSHTAGIGRSSYSVNAPPTLTEATLVRHNDDMEKGMVKKHKELRCNVRNSNGEKSKKQAKDAQSKDVNLEAMGVHGVKRSGSRSWEADTLQNHKHQHLADYSTKTQAVSGGMPTVALNFQNSSRPSDLNNPHILAPELWPPYSLSFPISSTQIQLTTNSRLSGRLSGVYLHPTAGLGHLPQEHPGPPPSSPEPSYVNGYVNAQLEPLIIPQPMESHPNQIPFHSIASITGVLLPNTNIFTGRLNFNADAAKPKPAYPVESTNESGPSGVRIFL